MAQLVRALAGWAGRLVPCLGSPVQSQAGSLQHIESLHYGCVFLGTEASVHGYNYIG